MSDGRTQEICRMRQPAKLRAARPPVRSGLCTRVFTCEIEETGSEEICVIEADGSGLRVLTDYEAGIGGVGSPDWAPARAKE